MRKSNGVLNLELVILFKYNNHLRGKCNKSSFFKVHTQFFRMAQTGKNDKYVCSFLEIAQIIKN